MRTGELISKKHRRSYARNFFWAAERATISPREDCCRLRQQRRRLSCGGSNLTHPAHRSASRRPCSSSCNALFSYLLHSLFSGYRSYH